MAKGRRRGPVLRLEGAERTYHVGKVDVPALRGASLEVGRGEFVVIVGPSGSGKTTLLNMAGLLDRPDAGEVWLGGQAASALDERARARLRRRAIGFIFQSFNLLPHLTAEENVALPLRYAEADEVRVHPAKLLERVGLGARRNHKPDELSGGEQQRVAIARALVLNPPLLLADEPTGELDSETAESIHALLDRLREAGKALLVVTHNRDLVTFASRTVRMRDGLIEGDGEVVEAREPVKPRPPKRKRSPSR